jgi:hypothetical protein
MYEWERKNTALLIYTKHSIEISVEFYSGF